MLAQTPTLHSRTPTLTATDPRGLTVRSVDYCRIAQGGPAESRVNRTAHDPTGRAIAQWDPRLFRDASAPANLASVYSLSGKVLSTISVDAGWRISLLGEADQLLHHWDGRGSQRRMEYDTLLRPQAVFEQALDEEFSCTERYLYGTADPAIADHNQCGQLIRHDDPAGTQQYEIFGLTGALLEQIQHFLRLLGSPDWPVPLEERNQLLEPGEGATTRSRFNPLGDVLEQTDAKGNRQFFRQTAGGQLREAHLQLSAQANRQTLVSAIQYNAHGQTEREAAGNGVITTLEYRPEDGRLIRLQAKRDSNSLQDLRYDYDPVGNVLSIEDAAQPIRYFANQRIDPISRYLYDSLYQLIQATGWEAGGPNKGPQFSAFDDPAPRANYRQTYRYDEGGNLLELAHDGPQQHGRTLTAARHSNRCLPEHNGRPPSEAEIAAAFDANGNLLNLQPGQALSWDLRNQLKDVRPVARDSGLNDSEWYVYGADGMRRRKIRLTQTNARTLITEVCYLRGLEVRSHSGTGEELQVIVIQAGRSAVRVLHWETEPPKGIANDQYRYVVADHLGSCTLELDSAGEVISQERYHPFGSTAWFTGRGEVEASYKTVRYSGKERDATGLYYYGLRYYMPWLQKWVNPDPAGSIDGLNLFRMLGNSPLNHRDDEGSNSYDVLSRREMSAIDRNMKFVARGLENFPADARKSVVEAITLGGDWLDKTIAGLKSSPTAPFTNEIMETVFGPDYSLPENSPGRLRQEILSIMEEVKIFNLTLSGENSWRLALLQGMGKSFGKSAPSNTQGNLIWLNDEYIKTAHPFALAKTVLHEAFHAMRSSKDPDHISDFWYLMTKVLLKNATALELESYVKGAMEASGERSEESPREDKMSKTGLQHYIKIFDDHSVASGKSPSTTKRKREEVFETAIAVRHDLVKHNADSLAVIAMLHGNWRIP